MSIPTAQQFIAKALAYVGYREGQGNVNKFSHELGRGAEFWCDDFVSGVAYELGASEIFGSHAYCPEHVQWFVNRGEWHRGASGIQAGDVGFILVDGKPGHVFAIVDVHRLLGYVVTIEGNTNNDGSSNGIGVFKRTRRMSSIYGYGRPRWAARPAVVTPPKPIVKPAPQKVAPISIVNGQTWSYPIVMSNGKQILTHVNRWVNVGVGQKYYVAVCAIQYALIRDGFSTVRVDGDFGPVTLSAVKRFQEKYGLVQDGLVGTQTAIKMRIVNP